jgi:hypothetical protein
MRRVAVVVFALFTLLCLTGCGGSPVNVIKDFLRKTADGDVAAVKELCTGDLYELVKNAESSIQWGKMQASNLGPHLMDMSQDDLRIPPYVKLKTKAGDSADVLVKIKAKSYDFKLKYVDGVWKISDIDQGLGGTSKKKLDKDQGIFGH